MKKLLRQLVEHIFKKNNKTPSELFMEEIVCLGKVGSRKSVDTEDVKKLLKQKSYQAFVLFESLQKTQTLIDLCFVLANLSPSSSCIVDELNKNIKKAALGFKVSHYSDERIVLLQGNVEPHIYEIVFQIYQYSCIYCDLRDSNDFSSMAMQYFNEIVFEKLKAYERCVMDQKEELLSFYVGMYSSFLKLKTIHRLHECYKHTLKQPFDFIKSNFSQPFALKIIHASSKHLNECVKEFILTGKFKDEFREFFIYKDNSSIESPCWETFKVQPSNVPSFINNEVVENVLYIGRCMDLIRWICVSNGLVDIQCFCTACSPINRSFNRIVCFKHSLDKLKRLSNEIDLLDKDFATNILQVLEIVDCIIQEVFVKKYALMECIEGIKNIFLCGRSDFLETLFHKLKEIRKLTKRSYGYVLDASIEQTIGYKNDFYSSIDVYLHENSSSYENFTLFSNIQYPLNIIITKEIIFDLSKIFKFLWIIKRVEHLLRRAQYKGSIGVKAIFYQNLLQKYYFYLFEEVIEPSFNLIFNLNNRKITEIHTNLQQAVKNILKKMYIDYETKIFYKFIKQLEELLINHLSNNTKFEDIEIRRTLASVNYQEGYNFIESVLVDISNIRSSF